MRSLIIISLLALLPFISSAQTMFKWKMDVQELALDGLFHTYDTTVIWGTNADTICFLFNFKVRCFYNPKWSNFDKKLEKKVEQSVNEFRRQNLGKDVHHTVMVKQNKFNEIYVIRFIYCDDGVAIHATNVVFGIPSYCFVQTNLHR